MEANRNGDAPGWGLTIVVLLNYAFGAASMICALGTMAGLIVFLPFTAGGWFFTLIPIVAAREHSANVAPGQGGSNVPSQQDPRSLQHRLRSDPDPTEHR